MASSSTTSLDSLSRRRPSPQNLKSFSRIESPPHDTRPRSRGSTLQDGSPHPLFQDALSSSPVQEKVSDRSDPFSTQEGPETGDIESTANPSLRMPQHFEELPIELRTLTERYDTHK